MTHQDAAAAALLFEARPCSPPAVPPGPGELEALGGARLRRLLTRRAVIERRPVHLYRGGAAATSMRVDGVEATADALFLTGTWAGDAALEPGTYRATIVGPTSMQSFDGEVVAGLPGRARMRVGKIAHSGFRASPRADPGDGCLVTLPAGKDVAWSDLPDSQVRDVSSDGLGVLSDRPLAAALGAELPLHIKLLDLPEVENVHARGAVRSHGLLPDGRHRYGIELVSFARPADRECWRRFVFRRTHPRSLQGRESGGLRAWQALRGSGYVELFTHERERGDLKERFVRTWGEASATCGKHVVIEQGGRPVATIGGSQVYPSTWLIHHVGIDAEFRSQRGRRALVDIARELYSAIFYHFLHGAEADHVLIYFERRKRWSQLFYRDFVLRHPDKSGYIYDRYKMFRCEAALEPAFVDPTLQIVSADSEHLDLLSSCLARRLRPLELEALAYCRRDLDLRSYCEQSRRRGDERGREIRIALRDGEPVGAMIAETGSLGVNIFGLLDQCKIVGLGSPLVTRAAAYAALLTDARRYFAQQGRRRFVLITPPGTDDAELAGYGCAPVGEGQRCIVHRRLLPAWLAHIDEIEGGDCD